MPIHKICKIHAIKYGKNKKPAVEPNWVDSYCDVCEATGNNNVPQSVATIESFGGISGDLFQHIKVEQPNP